MLAHYPLPLPDARLWRTLPPMLREFTDRTDKPDSLWSRVVVVALATLIGLATIGGMLIAVWGWVSA